MSSISLLANMDPWCMLVPLYVVCAVAGLAGSPTKVHRVQAIVLTKQGYTEIPATEDGVRRLIRELVVDHTLG